MWRSMGAGADQASRHSEKTENRHSIDTPKRLSPAEPNATRDLIRGVVARQTTTKRASWCRAAHSVPRKNTLFHCHNGFAVMADWTVKVPYTGYLTSQTT